MEKQFSPAEEALETARRLPGGALDFEVHYLLAKTLYGQLRLEEAFPMARTATSLATNPSERRKADRFLAGLLSFFGGVTLSKAPEARTSAGYVYLENLQGFIHPDKKQIFSALRDRYGKSAFQLPVTLYLPFGRYRANQVPFETSEGQTTEVRIIPDAQRSTAASWWVVGGGLVAALVSGAAAWWWIQPATPSTPTLRLSGTGL